jgi:hypothetical protein
MVEKPKGKYPEWCQLYDIPTTGYPLKPSNCEDNRQYQGFRYDCRMCGHNFANDNPNKLIIKNK